MAEIHERLANHSDAATHYRTFVELWSGGDADFQPAVEAAQRRLAELLAF